jgi:RHS repeat-associated protein
MVRMGNALPGDGAPNVPVKYHFGDHLGSSNIVIGGQDVLGNTFINREEYFSYGETSFGSFTKKRYRFTGKERDEESGLYYHGARYYAPWLARWVSRDPVESTNVFCYALCNPARFVDPSGEMPRTPEQSPDTGPYRTVRGDHVHQVASRTENPGAKRESASQYRSALSVSTKDPSYLDKGGQNVERAINRAAWGKDYEGRPAGQSGKVTVTATGTTAVGKTQPATPSQWLEDQKSYWKLQEAGYDPDRAGQTVRRSGQELQQAEATPKRVPDAPRNVPRGLQQGQDLSVESPGKVRGVRLPGWIGTTGSNLASGAKFGLGIAGLAISATQNTPHYWESQYDTDAADVGYTVGKFLHWMGISDNPPLVPPHHGGDPLLYFHDDKSMLMKLGYEK